MRRCSLVLAAALTLAGLLAGGAVGGPPAGDASPAASPRSEAATPIPQVLIGQPPAWDPLPDGCSPERVTGLVLEFVAALNRGDATRLAALFRPDVPDADGRRDAMEQPRAGWFAVTGEPGVTAWSDAELVAWAAARAARGERWTVLQLFMGGYWWRGGVNVSFDLRREATDVPAVTVGGKGALDCDDGTVYLWTMGGGTVLPEHLFDPEATVSPAVGFAPGPRLL